jgi:hypothetical protein
MQATTHGGGASAGYDEGGAPVVGALTFILTTTDPNTHETLGGE